MTEVSSLPSGPFDLDFLETESFYDDCSPALFLEAYGQEPIARERKNVKEAQPTDVEANAKGDDGRAQQELRYGIYTDFLSALKRGDKVSALDSATKYMTLFPDDEVRFNYLSSWSRKYINQSTVTIDLSDYIGKKEPPTKSEIASRVAAALGYTPDDMQRYGRTHNVNKPEDAFFAVTGNEKEALADLVQRAAKSPMGTVMIAELKEGALAEMRQWIENDPIKQNLIAREREAESIKRLNQSDGITIPSDARIVAGPHRTSLQKMTDDLKLWLEENLPGYAYTNTPEGLKTDAAASLGKGLVKSATLGAVDLGPTRAVTEQRQALVDATGTMGEFIGALLPYAGTAKIIEYGRQIPKIKRAMDCLEEAGLLGRVVERATLSAANYGIVASAREGISVSKGGQTPEKAVRTVLKETVLGGTSGALSRAGADDLEQTILSGVPEFVWAAAFGEAAPSVDLTGNAPVDAFVFNTAIGYITSKLHHSRPLREDEINLGRVLIDQDAKPLAPQQAPDRIDDFIIMKSGLTGQEISYRGQTYRVIFGAQNDNHNIGLQNPQTGEVTHVRKSEVVKEHPELMVANKDTLSAPINEKQRLLQQGKLELQDDRHSGGRSGHSRYEGTITDPSSGKEIPVLFHNSQLFGRRTKERLQNDVRGYKLSTIIDFDNGFPVTAMRKGTVKGEEVHGFVQEYRGQTLEETLLRQMAPRKLYGKEEMQGLCYDEVSLMVNPDQDMQKFLQRVKSNIESDYELDKASLSPEQLKVERARYDELYNRIEKIVTDPAALARLKTDPELVQLRSQIEMAVAERTIYGAYDAHSLNMIVVGDGNQMKVRNIDLDQAFTGSTSPIITVDRFYGANERVLKDLSNKPLSPAMKAKVDQFLSRVDSAAGRERLRELGFTDSEIGGIIGRARWMSQNGTLPPVQDPASLF